MNRIACKINSILTKIARFLLGLLTGLENYLLKMPQDNDQPQQPPPDMWYPNNYLAEPVYVKVQKKEPRIPKFKPGDIVYVRFNPNQLGNNVHYPMIGGSCEVDCKVIYVLSASHDAVEYNLMSGTGTRIEVMEECLVPASEYTKERALATYTLRDAYELAVSGSWIKIEEKTPFYLIGEWVTSDRYGINIHISYFEKHLTELFDVIPRASV